MKLVAAAKLRRAQERILEARPYASKMQEVFGQPGRSGRTRSPPLLRAGHGHGSSRGGHRRQGTLRGLQLQHPPARSDLRAAERRGRDDLVVVGRKARDFYRRRPYDDRAERIGFFDRRRMPTRPRAGGTAGAGYMDGEAGRSPARLQRVQLGGVQRVVIERLLPIEPLGAEPEAAGSRSTTSTSRPPRPSWTSLLPGTWRCRSTGRCWNRLAGEQGARMTAMEAATKNAHGDDRPADDPVQQGAPGADHEGAARYRGRGRGPAQARTERTGGHGSPT